MSHRRQICGRLSHPRQHLLVTSTDDDGATYLLWSDAGRADNQSPEGVAASALALVVTPTSALRA